MKSYRNVTFEGSFEDRIALIEYCSCPRWHIPFSLLPSLFCLRCHSKGFGLQTVTRFLRRWVWRLSYTGSWSACLIWPSLWCSPRWTTSSRLGFAVSAWRTTRWIKLLNNRRTLRRWLGAKILRWECLILGVTCMQQAFKTAVNLCLSLTYFSCPGIL